MEAKELRLGNLVKSKMGDTAEVCKTTSAYYNDSMYGEIECYLTSGKGMMLVGLHRIEPIPLTEEWLIKFGFTRGSVKLGCQEYWTSDLGIYKMIGDYPHFAHGAMNDIRIKYVHQLQNLYFALTGEELELKEGEK